MLGKNGAPSSLSGGAGLRLATELRSHGPNPLDRARVPEAIAAGPLNVRQVLDFPTPSEAQVRALLDLTVAEARLARLLASGDTLEVVAQKLCIKLTTARSQLAAIFSKTGIRRQAKLVAILSRIAHLE
jgi:DNA-binding CsgD family transcriptional regulator